MNRTITHLLTSQQVPLLEVLGEVIRLVEPEKVICFGTRTHSTQIWSCFLPALREPITTEYDILIVTRENDKAKHEEICRRVRDLSNSQVTLVPIVHSLESVNRELALGNFFFCTLYHKGVLLYNNRSTQLVSLGEYNRDALSLPAVEKLWKKGWDLSNKFLDSAQYCLSKEMHDLAVLMLHQATEQMCLTIINVYMGYRPETNSLEKLLAIIENFSLLTITAFPRITTDEVKLFELLENAYTQIRYHNEGYTLPADAPRMLLEEVKELQRIVGLLYTRRLEQLAGKESSVLQPDYETAEAMYQ